MLIIKDNISRNIDENNLNVYLEKGYKVVEDVKETKKEPKSGK